MLDDYGFACRNATKWHAPCMQLSRRRGAAGARRGRPFVPLVGPRRYGETTLLRRVLEAAEREKMPTVLVDLQDVLSIGEIVVRIERGYDRLKGPIRRTAENLFRSWNIGLALGGRAFTAVLQQKRNVDAESVLSRLLELPAALFERDGTASLIAFDEIHRSRGPEEPRAAAARRRRGIRRRAVREDWA